MDSTEFDSEENNICEYTNTECHQEVQRFIETNNWYKCVKERFAPDFVFNCRHLCYSFFFDRSPLPWLYGNDNYGEYHSEIQTSIFFKLNEFACNDRLFVYYTSNDRLYDGITKKSTK